MSKKGKTYPHLQRENAYQWKGEDASYDARHHELRKRRGKASKCENRENGILAFECRENSDTYEWANVSGEYKRDLDDYMQICKSCHERYDLTDEKVSRLRKMAKDPNRTSWNKGKVLSREDVTCKNCGDEFSAFKSQERKFCCHKCSTKYYSGDNHHMRKN